MIAHSRFADITGSVISAAAETDDFGQYNVEYVTITDSEFKGIGGPVASLYRGGRDESTFGPHFTLTESRLTDVGRRPLGRQAASIVLHGVQDTRIQNVEVASSAPVQIRHTVGTPTTALIGNRFTDTPAPVVEELEFDGPARVITTDPARQ